MPDPTTMQMELSTEVDPKLRFKSMSAREEISRLFEFQIIAVSDDQTITADDLLGTEAKVSIEVADDTKRWFHGIVTAFGVEGVDGREFTYRMVVRPALWLATRKSDVRIFQNMTALDIVKQVLGDYSVVVTDSTTGTYLERVYCVQYRETDFNFVSRLLEEEGIFYFFKHSDSQHEMVLGDAPGVHEATGGFETLDYVEDDKDLSEVPAITDWHMRHEIQTGKFVLQDYNFETPSTNLKAESSVSTRSHAEHDRESYDYPGLYGAVGDGTTRAGIRLEEASARFTRYTGRSNIPGIAIGAKFTLANHPRDDQNAEYLILQTQIDMQQARYESGGDEDTLFTCRFVAQGSADPFRPARTTRKPTVAGPQTAVVVGGSDAEIETDEHGRIKVQFHWDRVGAKNADSSCWLRVATGWAGNGWGMISLPRVGQEVVVAFLEGDPDQPLVVGSVYNAEQKPPYELPAKANVSTLKSRSTKGGDKDTFNELRFDDTKGSEYLLLQAQKDRLEFVEGTVKSIIGVGDGEGNEHRTVKTDRKEKIGNEWHVTVTKDVKHKFDAKYGITVADAIAFKGSKAFGVDATEDIALKTGATFSVDATDKVHVKTAADFGAEATGNVYLKGMNVVIEAGTQLSLKVGGAAVVISSTGVSIIGTPNVMINSGGSAGSGSAPSPVAPPAPDAPKDPEAPSDPLTHR